MKGEYCRSKTNTSICWLNAPLLSTTCAFAAWYRRGRYILSNSSQTFSLASPLVVGCPNALRAVDNCFSISSCSPASRWGRDHFGLGMERSCLTEREIVAQNVAPDPQGVTLTAGLFRTC